MAPQLFGWIDTYGFFLVLGDLVGIAVAMYGAYRLGLAAGEFARGLVVVQVAALIGAKLYGLIERGGAMGSLSTELFGGYRYPGAVIAVVVSLVIIGRAGWLAAGPGALADAIAPSFGFAMAVARIGCLLAGCCAGQISDLPWAIRFPAGSQVWYAHREAGLIAADAATSLPVHPLQVYFGLLSLSLGWVLLWLQPRRGYPGQVFLVYVAIYGFGQFGLEFFRFSPLPHVQYMALGLALAASAALLSKPRRVPLAQPEVA